MAVRRRRPPSRPDLPGPRQRTVQHWEQFVETVGRFEQGSAFAARFAFRGHAHAEWALRTSLMRALEGRSLDAAGALEIETNATLQFQTQALLTADPLPILHVTDLRFHTDRMAAPQLLFTLSPQILADHGRLIGATLGGRAGESWQKLVLPAAVKPEFMRRLRAMNITARALFPGLDGLARSIRELVLLEAHRRPAGRAIRRVAAL